jgi:hypothetical protein
MMHIGLNHVVVQKKILRKCLTLDKFDRNDSKKNSQPFYDKHNFKRWNAAKWNREQLVPSEEQKAEFHAIRIHWAIKCWLVQISYWSRHGLLKLYTCNMERHPQFTKTFFFFHRKKSVKRHIHHWLGSTWWIFVISEFLEKILTGKQQNPSSKILIFQFSWIRRFNGVGWILLTEYWWLLKMRPKVGYFCQE